ncbi:DNA (cytosine-5-)-methyltransferase [uncultured Rikenella sp.]|uniref:DNA (cytosine-5-)-methyltransferase n=1 Tax=uncultured Rikenella sp. TaxID=368003 RepID=UPI0026179E70|nr:DNA (cytosine-5-)-methyltransferase [uncultured Rikenella sp.]
MKYIFATELAEKWNVTPAWITTLCKQGRLSGAKKDGRVWRIPDNTPKPKDKRSITSLPDSFKFIDLFAGIGGFHQAMASLGGTCVMAAEINDACVETYKLNFKVENNDIRRDVNKIDPSTIASFDVLCAGFPCQPFSKAGHQEGFNDKKRGGLFYKILDIIDAHPEAKFLILENVRNLADHTENWEIIKTELMKRDFYITEKPIILSPSDFGIPQIRERVYILGVKKLYRNFHILTNGYIHINDLELDSHRKKCEIGDAWTILEEEVPDNYIIPSEQEKMIFAWDELRKETGITILGYPLWIHCFGVNEKNTQRLKEQLGYNDMPDWKKAFVDQNRDFYLKNREFIDCWIEKHKMLDQIKLYKKFEWNCGTDVTDIKNAVIQIRQSGIRVKRPTFYPSLVAIVNTPIIWDEHKGHFRHITPREAANLQSFRKDFIFCGTDNQIYRQLGNAVNVEVVRVLSESLFHLGRWEVR